MQASEKLERRSSAVMAVDGLGVLAAPDKEGEESDTVVRYGQSKSAIFAHCAELLGIKGMPSALVLSVMTQNSL